MASTIILTVVILALLAERHLTVRAINTERAGWASERGLLLNRIKPEAAQYVDIHGPDLPAVPSDDTPAADDEYWARLEKETAS